MSVSGTDPSLHRGGGADPPNERHLNLDFALGALLYKAMTGQIPQDEIIDAALITGHPYGREQTTAGRPTLESPIWTMRGAQERQESGSHEFLNYDRLLNMLPEELKGRVIAEMQKPSGQRGAELAALNNVLIVLSYFLSWAETVARPLETAGAAFTRSDQNNQAPINALALFPQIMQEISDSGLTGQILEWADSLEHDKLHAHLSAFREASDLIEQFSNGEIGSEELAPPLLLLSNQYHHSSEWGQMQIAGVLFSGMATLALAASLPDGLPPLFLALALADIGSNGPQGAMGNSIYDAIRKTADLVQAAADPDATNAEKEIASRLATTFVLIGSFFIYTTFSAASSTSTDELTSTLLLQLFLHQPWLSSGLENLADGGGEQMQNNLELTALLIAIQMIGGDSSGRIIDAIAPELKEKISAAEATIIQLIETGYNAEELAPYAAALQNARLTIDNQDYEAFSGAVTSIFAALGAAPEEFLEELSKMVGLADALSLCLSGKALDDQTNTMTSVTQV